MENNKFILKNVPISSLSNDNVNSLPNNNFHVSSLRAKFKGVENGKPMMELKPIPFDVEFDGLNYHFNNINPKVVIKTIKMLQRIENKK